MKSLALLVSLSGLFTLTACSDAMDVESFKATQGMSKDQVESKFGKPASTSLDSNDDHPGGYWVYTAKSGVSCKLKFDLPPRVIGTDC